MYYPNSSVKLLGLIPSLQRVYHQDIEFQSPWRTFGISIQNILIKS